VPRAVAAEGAGPLALPALPEEGEWSVFEGRVQADPVALFVADWRVRTDLYLRLAAACDSPFEAAWGHTPDNPADVRRGSVVLRAPGKKRSFATVLEVHTGVPSLAGAEIPKAGTVRATGYDGSATDYRKPDFG
jgi:hypothetical protein